METMITTTKDLHALLKRAHDTDAVALDTEFIWERTYHPRLGLIQLALSDEECFIIDPIAIKDLSPLGELLANPEVVKIFHDAPQDLAILKTATGYTPKNIFDSRLAAGFASLGSTLSLTALVERLLDIKLSKSETRTNWLKRPLAPEQIAYALDDVRYLRAVRVLLLARILPETSNWLKEELELLDDPQSYSAISDNQRYTRIRGVGKLDRSSLAILQKLTCWRESEARKKNKPRGHIIKDAVLLNIAKDALSEPAEISACKGISHRSVQQYGEKVAQLVAACKNREEVEFPPLIESYRLGKNEKKQLSSLQEYITLKSDICGIDPILLGNKKELVRYIRNTSAPCRQTEGWRQKFLAEIGE